MDKLIKVKNIIIAIVVIIPLFLFSCNDSNNSSENSYDNEDIQQGYFIFGPVEGLEYECGDLAGTTDSDGLFEYYENESVSFYIGDFLIGSIVGKSRVTPLDFIGETEDETVDVTTAMNISKLLINTDDDQNPNNGIVINQKLIELIGYSQDFYPNDICVSMNWDDVDYLIFYNSPVDSQTCEPETDETLYQIVIENDSISNSVLSIDADTFENNASIANLFLNAFIAEGEEVESFLQFSADSYVTPGYYTSFWGLPSSYNEYQTDLVEKHLQFALFSPYIGTYSGSYSGDEYSGDMVFSIEVDYFSNCSVYDTYGDNTLDGETVRIYGDLTDSDTGYFEFNLSKVWFVFKGNIDPDTGEATGVFYDHSGNYLGTFNCNKI